MQSRKFCGLKCYLNSGESRKGRYTKGHTTNLKSNDPQWRGKKTIGNHGYLTITKNGKTVLEHRAIMEEHIGRPLRKTEHVHHIDGNRINNVISNLMLFPTNKAHLEYHWKIDTFKNRINH